MADLISMLAAASGIGAEEADPNFNQTVLLLHGDGTNGAQNNTFLDSSTNNFTITRNGNTTQGTFSPFSLAAGEWSNFFDGTGDSLTWSGTTLSSNFTVECWVYKTAVDGSPHTNVFYGSGNNQFAIDYGGVDGSIALILNAATVISGSGTAITLDAWHHIAWVREGTTCRAYVNGVQQGTGTSSASFTLNEIGRYGPGGYEMNGYISNIRITNACLYPSGTTFTPSALPFTTTVSSGTVQLLTCQSNRFVDNSSSPKTITRNGDVRVTPFSPFAPSAAYSPSVNGGSGYFDGTGDFLSIADNAAFELSNSNFAIEAWVYPLALPASNAIANIASQYITTGSRSFLFAIYNNSGTMQLLFQPVSGTTDTAISQNFAFKIGEWAHIAAVRSGNNITLYGNGASLGTTAYSSTINNATGPYLVGCRYNASSAAELLFTGYIAGHRLIVGSATAPSGIPTTPPTDVTNTKLLLNFTNAGIFDNTGKNNLETVGNAQIDTTIKKFGTGSMDFDGTGDYLIARAPTNNFFAFGTGNFTIEFWLYLNSTAQQIVYDGRPGSATPTVYYNSNAIRYYANAADRITGATLNTGQWYHIAVSRSGTSTKLFVDGTQSGSTYTDSTNYTTSTPIIGADANSGTFNNGLNGYIDDLRITKGVARYTSNFTPPTAAFPNE